MDEFPEMEISQQAPSLDVDDLAANGEVVFRASSTEYSNLPDPSPAEKLIPEWFRDLPPTLDAFKTGTKATVKLCFPFKAALTSGWLLRAPQRIDVRSPPNGDLEVEAGEKYATVLESVSRGSSVPCYPKPDMLVNLGWSVSVPPGYGVLITAPINRHSMEYRPMSLFHVPDQDDLNHPSIELPLHVQASKAVIQKGEPLATVLPLWLSPIKTLRVGPLESESDLNLLYKRLQNRMKSRVGAYISEIGIRRPSKKIVDSTESPGGELTKEIGQPDTDKKLCSPSDVGLTVAPLERTPRVESASATRTDFGVEVPQVPSDAIEIFCLDSYIDSTPRPVPSRQYVPEWLKKGSTSIAELVHSAFPITEGLRYAMSLGVISRNPAGERIRQSGDYEVEPIGSESFAGWQPDSRININHPQMPFKILSMETPWKFRTPRDTSTLLTHPFNYVPDDWYGFSGILESDTWFAGANGVLQVSLNDSEMTIPKGAPICQLIPFDRRRTITNWRMDVYDGS